MSLSLYFLFSTGKTVPIDGDCNMSNTNARAVLSGLGLGNDWETLDKGIEIDEFISAITLFMTSDLADLIDTGKPVSQSGGEGSALLIDCGRREGYIMEKAAIMGQMAHEAKSKGAAKAVFF
jgi:hypothetical protein